MFNFDQKSILGIDTDKFKFPLGQDLLHSIIMSHTSRLNQLLLSKCRHQNSSPRSSKLIHRIHYAPAAVCKQPTVEWSSTTVDINLQQRNSEHNRWQVVIKLYV